MTMPIPSVDPPKDVQTVDTIGAATQNLNPTKVTSTATGRMSQGFLDTNAGLAGSVVSTATNLFGQFAGKIADDTDSTTVSSPDDVADQVQGFFSNPVTALFSSLLTFLSPILQGLTSGLSGVAATLAGLFQIRWDQVDNHEVQINDAISLGNQNSQAITDLSDYIAAAKATAAYTGNYNDMVTVPRVLLGPQVSGVTVASDSHSHTKGTLSANTSTGVISGSTDADSHAHSATVAKGLPAFTPSVTKLTSPGTGKVYYTPIIADREGSLDKFRFITGADSSLFSIDAYYVALMVYDIPAAKFRTLWNPGDIKGSMGSSLSEVSLAMGLTGAAAAISPGQVLIAAHSQTAPGLAQTPRSVAWVPQAGVARTSDVLLPGCYWVSNSILNGFPSEVNVSDLTERNDGIPWYAVSVTNA